MFQPVPTRCDLVAQEHSTLDFWERTKAFDGLRQLRKGAPRWSFLDGPITANGPMGVHHAWGRTLKDCYQRYFAMLGYEQRYENGFDCQGLWIEVEVERELGFRSKRDIEEYGLERFVEQCKARAHTFADVQTQQSVRLGYWMDWSDSYYTLSDENNYTIWSFLKRCHERGLIYKGKDTMPWCPRCGTGISQHEMHEGYKQVTESSVILALPLRERENEHLLVWTTTPWTLAANVACAVHPEIEYVTIRRDGKLLYLSAASLEKLPLGDVEQVGDPVPGEDLVGLTYDGPFDELPAQAEVAQRHVVIPWDEVSDVEGTGIVHSAPGCGREDFELSRLHDLPVIAPIDESGVYLDGFGPLTGKDAVEVEQIVYDSLRDKGYLVEVMPYTHSYPHCWRCATALLFRNVDEWFIDMSWRDEIMAVARQINWIPAWGLDQELDWLENMRDWMISKKRYWGLALPIWECPECGTFDVIGGKDELQRRAVEGWDEFDGHSPHRPWVDAVKIACPGCGATMSRIPDVGNPWLDAGIVPYSTVHYNTDREYWRQWIPADLVLECFPGQFRNWFYALLAMSTMMENIPPFKTLLGYALVRDEHGEEMHKSKGNAIEFDEAAERMGVDVMRWMFCRQSTTANLNFSYTPAEHLRRAVIDTLWNVYAFFCNYGRLDEFDPRSEPVPLPERSDMDRWIISKLHQLIQTARREYEAFNVSAFVHAAEAFIERLSNWYVRRSRRRFWRAKDPSDREKLAAYQTLYEVLLTLCKLLAPVIPFITETMYQNLVRPLDGGAPASVHHCEFPEAIEEAIDEQLSRDMDAIVGVVSQVLALREQAQIRVRQPLAELKVAPADEAMGNALRRFEPQLLEEVNVKRLTLVDGAAGLMRRQARANLASVGPRFGAATKQIVAALEAANGDEVAARLAESGSYLLRIDGDEYELSADDIELEQVAPEDAVVGEQAGTTAALDIALTPELEAEGLARDVVRHIQQLRKERDLEMSDRIRATYRTDAEKLQQAIQAFDAYIRTEVLADSLEQSDTLGAEAKQVTVQGMELGIDLKRQAKG